MYWDACALGLYSKTNNLFVLTGREHKDWTSAMKDKHRELK
jgi:hypothetical protein